MSVPEGGLQHISVRPTSHPSIHPALLQRNAEFKHAKSDTPFTLTVPEFTARPGELVAVCGRVGAGKSSLINAILGNMQLVHGTSNCGELDG